MALFDLPLAELEKYRPQVAEPSDFDDFWKRTIDEARSHDLNRQNRGHRVSDAIGDIVVRAISDHFQEYGPGFRTTQD